MTQKIKSLLINSLLFALIIGCTEDETPFDLKDLKFNAETIELVEGITYNLDDYLSMSGADAAKAQITLESANSDIVSVDGSEFTAVAVGETKLTATEDNSSLTTSTAVKVVAKTVAVTGVTLDQQTADMKVGKTLQLKATLAPADASEAGMTWSIALKETGSTAVEEIATVSNTGLVTAKSAGDVIVTVKTTDGGFTATTAISITNIAVTGVSISETSINVVGNEEVQLTAVITPEDATIKTVTWSLEINLGSRTNAPSDPYYYANIDSETGILTGNDDCPECIYAVATTTDGEKVAKVPVTITYVAVTSVTLSPDNVTLDPDETQQMTATILPANANNQEITWSLVPSTVCRILAPLPVANPSDYVTLDENGLVTGIKNYEDTFCGIEISASVFDGPSDKVYVTVNKVIATSVTIDQGNDTYQMPDTNDITLTATVLPENTTDPNIVWSIDDPDPSVSVNASTGQVSPLKLGTTTVIATNTASGQTDTIDINVYCASCLIEL